MYLNAGPHASCAQAWLAAANAIETNGGDAYNLIVDIEQPLETLPGDDAILAKVDGFLRSHNAYSLATVANTIFPLALLQKHGPEKFYSVYHETIWKKMKSLTGDWGRYFHRLTYWKKPKANGAKGFDIINPLADLITFMKTQIASGQTHRHVYELTVYDPARDAGKPSNRQCLSFLSFKLTRDNRLLLTAVYRNHHYLARALGNFLGLARLQAFVADQAGIQCGSLTCLATHAEIDHHKSSKDGCVSGWSKTEARDLLAEIRSLQL